MSDQRVTSEGRTERVRLIDAKVDAGERLFGKLPIEIWIEQATIGWRVQWQMPDLDGGPVTRWCWTLSGARRKREDLIAKESGMKVAP